MRVEAVHKMSSAVERFILQEMQLQGAGSIGQVMGMNFLVCEQFALRIHQLDDHQENDSSS
jgi:hypothetical protein